VIPTTRREARPPPLTFLSSNPATGASSQQGVLLNPKYTVYTIEPDASGIALG